MTDVQLAVLTKMKAIMTDTSLNTLFYEMVLLRLESLGYELKETDGWLLCFNVQKVENHTRMTCNIIDIPEELYQNMCDVVCGEFLAQKKSSGELPEAETNRIVTSIRMGDTQVSFAAEGVTFDTLVNGLIHGKEGDLICYRRFKW